MRACIRTILTSRTSVVSFFPPSCLSRCVFCWVDDWDFTSRLLETTDASTNDNNAGINHVKNPRRNIQVYYEGEDDDDFQNDYMYDMDNQLFHHSALATHEQLRFDNSTQITFDASDLDEDDAAYLNEVLAADVEEDDDDNDDGNISFGYQNENSNASNGTKSESESSHESSGRRRLGSTCGGCYRLIADGGGLTRTYDGKLFLRRTTLKHSPYAVTIHASSTSKDCFTPAHRVNLFDTSKPGTSKALGIPNRQCSPPGPGTGWGGTPKKNNGKTNNQFRNCYIGKYQNAITVQKAGPVVAVCDKHFIIEYTFRYPVTLNKIGLLNVVDNRSVEVIVVFEDKTRESFWAKRGGPNSFEKMGFKGMRRVWRVKIHFRKGQGGE